MSPSAHDNAIFGNNNAIKLYNLYPAFLITFFCITIFGFMQHITVLRFEDGFGMLRGDALSLAGGTMTGASFLMIVSQTLGVQLFKGKVLRLLIVGALFLFFSMLGVTMAQHAYQLVIALQFMGISLGLILPGNLAFLSLVTDVGAQGKAAGFNSAAQGLGMALGPFGGAVLYHLSALAPSLLAIMLTIIVFAIIILKIKGFQNDNFSR